MTPAFREARIRPATPRRTGPAPRHDYAAVLPQALAEGTMLKDVAARLGVTHTVIHKRAVELGLDHLTPKARRVARVMDLFAQGYGLPEIAAKVGCCTNTVRHIVQRAGRYVRSVENQHTGTISRRSRAALRAAIPPTDSRKSA